MATIVNLTSSGYSATIRHSDPATPDYEASISLDGNLNLSIRIYDLGYGTFILTNSGRDSVGYLATGANGQSISDTGTLVFGSGNSGNFGYGNSVSFSADLSSLTFPITLSILCRGCDPDEAVIDKNVLTTWQNGESDFIFYDARSIAKPVIVSTTGTTIRVRDSINNQGKVKCITTNSSWYDSPHTFTGLDQGTVYQFICKDSNDTESDSVNGRTWNISGSSSSGLTSLIFTATHRAGTNGDSTKTITYKLYTSKSTSSTLKGTKTSNSGETVTFTGLDANTTYYCYAYTTGINNQNGNPDNTYWITAKTKKEADPSTNTSNASATTIRASVSWSSAGTLSTSCTVSCNGQYRNLSTSGGYVGFTGLTPGTAYTVSYSVVKTYQQYDEEGNPNGTYNTEETGSFSITTKKATLIINESSDITSKIIRFKSNSNYSSDTMNQMISPGDGWEEVDQNTYSIYNNLTHNSTYTISCRIAGCYAFNTSGQQTSVNDSVVSKTVSTLLLSLSASISEERQHSVTTLWQAYVGGRAVNSDAISGYQFVFTYMDTLARKANPPYQAAEVIEGSNGYTTGDYQSDRKIYSRNLTWYYCEYTVTASITDGFNIAAAAITVHTIFPATWIYSGGQWHRYIPHVFTNGKYVPAPAFVYKINKYIESNGE